MELDRYLEAERTYRLGIVSAYDDEHPLKAYLVVLVLGIGEIGIKFQVAIFEGYMFVRVAWLALFAAP